MKQRNRKITVGILLAILLGGCATSLGSKVKVTKSFVLPDTYKYSLVETYKARPHGLDGLYRVSERITYFDFYTKKLGWIDGSNVEIKYRPTYNTERINKSNAKFYFGRNKLIIKNLIGCDTFGNECGELRINGEYKIQK